MTAPPVRGLAVRLPGLCVTRAPKVAAKLDACPVIDARVIPMRWSWFAPTPGKFQPNPDLEREVSHWTAQGRTWAQLGFYGDQDFAPVWILNEPGVKIVQNKDGEPIPAVWPVGFLEKYLAPFLAQFLPWLASRGIQACNLPAGHIGHLAAQPSGRGKKSFVAAGWTATAWADYVGRLHTACKGKLPLYLLNSGELVGHEYSPEAATICALLSRQEGVGVIRTNLQADPADPERNAALMAQFWAEYPLVKSWWGAGDDWPLYDPDGHGGANDNRPLAWTEQALKNAFGLPGHPQATAVIWCQADDALATEPAQAFAVARKLCKMGPKS